MADFVTPVGRVSFPSLFETNKNGKYEATILLDKTEDKVKAFIPKLKAVIKAKIEEEWPKADKRPNVKAMNFALKDGDSEVTTGKHQGKTWAEVRPENAGHWMITARSQTAPNVVDQNRDDIPASQAATIKAGHNGRCSFNVYAYDNETVGIGFGLQNFQYAGKNTEFGNRSRPNDDFDDLDPDLADLGGPVDGVEAADDDDFLS